MTLHDSLTSSVSSPPAVTAPKLVFYDDLKPVYGIRFTRPHIWRMVQAGRFPQPMKPFGPNSHNAWTHGQILAWIAARFNARDGQSAA